MSETAEKKAEDPAPSVQAFQSCAGPGQDGSTSNISGTSLSGQQPKPGDHGIHAHCLNRMATLSSEIHQLWEQLKVAQKEKKKMHEEGTKRITDLQNDLTHQELMVKVGQEGIKAQVLKLVEKIERLRQQLPTTPICQRCTPVVRQWSPPPSGELKMNVDAAISLSLQRCGGGAVIRNSDGLYICGFSFPIPYHDASIIVEHYALGFAAEKAYEMRFLDLIVETDSLNLFQELHKAKPRDRLEEGCKESLGKICRPGRFIHCCKASNHLAQNLAQIGLGLDTCVFGADKCPDALYPYWALDLPSRLSTWVLNSTG